MTPRRPHPRAHLAGCLLAAWLVAGGSAQAVTVDMPTPQGSVAFDSTRFAASILAGPGGSFGCFTGGSLGDCTATSLALGILGSDLTAGLTLGSGGDITLSFAVGGAVLAVWEAGDFSLTGDAANMVVSVHSAAGWSPDHAYGAGHIARVLNDTQPSGYATNYGQFSAADFGLGAQATFDQVRLRTAAGSKVHVDLLAIAALDDVSPVPEPTPSTVLLAGLIGVVWLARRRQPR